MSKEIIKTIEIEIAGVTVKVTPKEAKNLHEALGELLNIQPKVKVVEREVIRDRFYPRWQEPFVYLKNTTGEKPNGKYDFRYLDNSATAKLKIQG